MVLTTDITIFRKDID